METYKRQKIFTNYACFCSSTMLTSKIITEIIENPSEFSGARISAINLFQFDIINHEITHDPLMRRHLLPFWKSRNGNTPAIYLLSGVPVCRRLCSAYPLSTGAGCKKSKKEFAKRELTYKSSSYCMNNHDDWMKVHRSVDCVTKLFLFVLCFD